MELVETQIPYGRGYLVGTFPTTKAKPLGHRGGTGNAKEDIERQPYHVDWILENVYGQDFRKSVEDAVVSEPERFESEIPSNWQHTKVLALYYREGSMTEVMYKKREFCRTLISHGLKNPDMVNWQHTGRLFYKAVFWWHRAGICSVLFFT